MKRPRIDIGSIRREQIVEAAVAVIAEQGLQNLTLSEIETRAGMSRGQLMYYFPTKEDILLAVFDRLLQLMYQRIGRPDGPQGESAGGAWELVQHLLGTVPEQPRRNPDFHCLQYTFLSQVGHRADFRDRLATLYEEWRSRMAHGLANDMARRPAVRSISPRALATLIQAILHGLAMQAVADPQAVQTEEMLHVCLDMLATYIWGSARNGKKPAPRTKKTTTKRAAPRKLPEHAST